MDQVRHQLLKTGLRLETMTILWMLAMALVTTVSGIQARSALLLTVGAGSAIDMLSACALYWELSREAKGAAMPTPESEQRVARLVGTLLLLTAVYAAAVSGFKLWTRAGAENSAAGITVALIAALWMPFLGRSKTRLAGQLKSRALHADGVGTIVCGYMSIVVLLGLAANATFRWWWLDSVGALLLVPMLLKEAWEAWTVRE